MGGGLRKGQGETPKFSHAQTHGIPSQLLPAVFFGLSDEDAIFAAAAAAVHRRRRDLSRRVEGIAIVVVVVVVVVAALIVLDNGKP